MFCTFTTVLFEICLQSPIWLLSVVLLFRDFKVFIIIIIIIIIILNYYVFFRSYEEPLQGRNNGAGASLE
jgi:hypothetical protein